MTNITYLSHHYDCVGAIDITHFRASVPSKMHARFRGPNAVAMPLVGQGVPCPEKKKKIIYNSLIFFICLP